VRLDGWLVKVVVRLDGRLLEVVVRLDGWLVEAALDGSASRSGEEYS